ncbi:3-deoxy-D-manno-octulosonic acid transferase [Limibaculum sp. M0105]|uniref:3-deoxy-D-manno-octulosonic acid transferase n=1 Tax=Thermohalobaculum xanthum TaxID=2753746 RepID=A0A8J7M3X8_9RHOB|nr:3-deoxy-D-manno-octulosonic acid transferase [Thermohalobaculum xanthum]MBK0397886.1 3-deoxy-D-manno-octulosonic acid transferase [Thermohalobaculum xanthum]
MTFSAALSAYLIASRAAGLVAPMILRRRLARGKEDPARLAERLGRADVARPAGRLVWLHGASVGEAVSLLPVIRELGARDPDLHVLVTTGTVTSARRLASELPAYAVHQFVPLDTAGSVRRFLDRWRPDLAIWAESEFWPRLMIETSRRHIPMMLVNARVSARSASRWRRLPGMARILVRLFDRIVTQDAPTRERLIAMGADPARVREGGNLKMLAMPPRVDQATLEEFRDALGDRPVWLAASTHPPEEEVVLAAHRLIAQSVPDLLTILAPRHPERAAELSRWLRQEGLALALRSEGDLPTRETEIYLADSLGEMDLWLRLAPIALVGGSLADMGGHNPFEPAELGAAILHGPHVENFAPAYAVLTASGGALVVSDAASLAQAAKTLLLHPTHRSALVAAAREALEQSRPDVGALVTEALALLPRSE